MYACGPTVYARAHIGNFRTFVCLDVLRRTMKYLSGHEVRQAVNYTDVDDKTIAGAQAAGVPLREYTDKWIALFREDSAVLGIETPEDMPRATDEGNLRAMSDMILALE
jgi:cysteinyl-tRNA synthetase